MANWTDLSNPSSPAQSAIDQKQIRFLNSITPDLLTFAGTLHTDCRIFDEHKAAAGRSYATVRESLRNVHVVTLTI